MVKKKNDETPPETVPEKAETHVETVSETPPETPEEGVLSASVINKVFHQRMKEDMSLREIAEDNGLSLSTVQRMLEGIEVEDLQEPSDQEAKSIEASLPTTIQEIEPTQIPDGYTLKPSLTPEEYQKFAKMDKPALLSEVVNLKATNSSLQARAILRKGDGEPSQYGSNNYIDALGRLVDKVAMQKQAERIVEKMFPSENNESLDRKFEKLEDKIERLAEKPKTDNIEKAVEVIGKIFEKAQGNQPQQAQRHPLDNLAIEYVIKDVQNAKQHGGEANEYTLKDTEMRNLHDIEMKKLGWEIAKYEKGESTTERVLETIKAVMAGPIGEAVKSLGNSAARRIEGQGQPPQLQDILCPSCGKSFPIISGSKTVVCPSCRATLALMKQPPPEQPQPQPQEPQPQVPSAETPQTETPQAQPQETPSEPKKHPDVLENF